MASGRRFLVHRPLCLSTACQRRSIWLTGFSESSLPVESSASFGMMLNAWRRTVPKGVVSSSVSSTYSKRSRPTRGADCCRSA